MFLEALSQWLRFGGAETQSMVDCDTAGLAAVDTDRPTPLMGVQCTDSMPHV